MQTISYADARVPCTASGCKATAYARGMCEPHYKRWHRLGTVELRSNPTPRMRFDAMTDKSGECWEWRGALQHAGYGQFTYAGKNVRAHRWAYEQQVGPIPDDMELHHRCGNRRCVRLEHLEVTTHRRNVLLSEGPCALNARKTHCKRGHPLSGDNVRIEKTGSRRCLTCQRASRASA